MRVQEEFVKRVHEVFLQRTSGDERTVTLRGLSDAVCALVEGATLPAVYEAASELRKQGWILVEDGTWGPDTQLFRRDEFI